MPEACPDTGVGNYRLIRDRVGVYAREAFGNLHLIAMVRRAIAKPRSIIETSDIDDQRVAFPMTHRIAEVRRLHVRRVRSSIRWNDANAAVARYRQAGVLPYASLDRRVDNYPLLRFPWKGVRAAWLLFGCYGFALMSLFGTSLFTLTRHSEYFR